MKKRHNNRWTQENISADQRFSWPNVWGRGQWRETHLLRFTGRNVNLELQKFAGGGVVDFSDFANDVTAVTFVSPSITGAHGEVQPVC